MTRVDSGKPERSCKMRVGEYRRNAVARIESVSFPRNHPERKGKEKKIMVCFDTAERAWRYHIDTHETHIDTQSTQREIQKKKETIDYSTK